MKTNISTAFQVLHETGVSTWESFHLATAQYYMNSHAVGCNRIFQNVIMNSRDEKMWNHVWGLGPQNCQFWGPLITKVIKFKISQFSAFTVLSIYSQLSWDFKSGSWIHELHDKAINLFSQLFYVGPLLGFMYCKKCAYVDPGTDGFWLPKYHVRRAFGRVLTGCSRFFSLKLPDLRYWDWKRTIPKRSVVGRTYLDL